MLSFVRVSDFSLLSSHWNDLHRRSRSPSVFTSFEWQTTWWRSFGREADLYLWALWDGPDLKGVAPLMKQAECFSFVGGRAVSDYLDFVVAPGYERELARHVIEALDNERWETVVLRGLRRDSPSLSTLLPLVEAAGWVGRAEVEDVSPAVYLPPTWDAYLASLNKKDRHELRRKMRRLDNSASWRWYVRTGRSAQPADLDDFLRLLRLSGPNKAEFMDRHMEQFFRAALGGLIPSEVARLYFMEIDGQRVASAACFDQGEELWLYNSGFEPAYSTLSVGLLLKALCLQDAIALRKTRFDFLRGSEAYKYDLGAVDQPVYCLRVNRGQQEVAALPRFQDER